MSPPKPAVLVEAMDTAFCFEGSWDVLEGEAARRMLETFEEYAPNMGRDREDKASA